MKIIVVGAGEVGFHIAGHLAYENKDVVVVDKDPRALQRVSENSDVQVINGSGSSPMILEEAGLKKADILLAVTNSDETNLIACLVADIISPATKKLARVRDADFDDYYDYFRDKAPHIDTIINPEIEVVKTIDRLMNVPGAVDVGEFENGRVKFVGIYLDEAARIAGLRLSDLPSQTDGLRILIAALVREDKLIIPKGNDRLLPGDLVYFISEEKNLIKTLSVFDKRVDPIKRLIIVGGGRIGFRLASLLDQRPINAKIIEQKPERCNELAEKLNKVVVLCGDGSDQGLLSEENVQEADVVITLTDDEETNILTSLLAKRMGTKRAITRISKFSYFNLMSTIGIKQAVNPRLSAINSILKHIRRGKVISAMSIKDEQAEVMEAVAMETSDIVGKPIKKMSFPKDSMVACIIREDDIIIPSGDSVIEPGDRVIIFTLRAALPKIEKILAVKLEYF